MEAAAAFKHPRLRIGALLLRSGLLSADQLAEALEEKEATDSRIGEIVVQRGWVSDVDLARTLAEQFNLDFVDLDSTPRDEQTAGLIVVELARRLRAVPVALTDQGAVVVAVADPTVETLDELGKALGVTVRLAVAPASAIARAIDAMDQAEKPEEHAPADDTGHRAWEAPGASDQADDAPLPLRAVDDADEASIELGDPPAGPVGYDALASTPESTAPTGLPGEPADEPAPELASEPAPEPASEQPQELPPVTVFEPRRPLLGSLLLRDALLTPPQLAEALIEKEETEERLGEILLRRGWITEDSLSRLLAEQFGLTYLDLAANPPEDRAGRLLSAALARYFWAVPIRFVEGDSLLVAIADPTAFGVEDLERALGLRVVLALATESAIEQAIARLEAEEDELRPRPVGEPPAAAAPAPEISGADEPPAEAENPGDPPLPPLRIVGGPEAGESSDDQPSPWAATEYLETPVDVAPPVEWAPAHPPVSGEWAAGLDVLIQEAAVPEEEPPAGEEVLVHEADADLPQDSAEAEVDVLQDAAAEALSEPVGVEAESDPVRPEAPAEEVAPTASEAPLAADASAGTEEEQPSDDADAGPAEPGADEAASPEPAEEPLEPAAGSPEARGTELVPHFEHQRPQLGTLLMRNGLLTPDQLAEALEEKEATGDRLGDIVLRHGWVAETDLARTLADQHRLEFVDIATLLPNPAVATLLPEKYARRYEAVPTSFLDNDTLLVAVADPTNVLAGDELRLVLGPRIKLVVATRSDIAAILDRLYPSLGEEAEAPALDAEAEAEDEETAGGRPFEVLEQTGGSPAVEFVNEVIRRAIQDGASDVHFEPQAERLLVRARIDGVMRDLRIAPARLTQAVTARLKIMGELDIAERRVPQDGRVTIRFGGKPVDLRVAVMPTTYGEQIVLRILYRTTKPLGFEELGLAPDTIAQLTHAIGQPYGAVIAVGPTGSGKTTTLYAALGMLNSKERCLMTIEDPVEYQLEGVNQIQVNVRAGLTFAQGLRTILRSDPDVLLVGEIRDAETAKIAVQAAMTGHLVLSTLHADNVGSAVSRLTDMGVERELLATTINCLFAQRLARKLCQTCREPFELDVEELIRAGAREADLPVGGSVTLFRARGCPQCAGGYKGRIGLFETLALTPQMRRLIETGTAEEIYQAAVTGGMRTLQQDGLRLCLEGHTSLEEARRVAGEPRI